MNCQEFEKLTPDLASERLIDADARVRGLAHAGECAHCSARLSGERALNTGLQALAAATAQTAPAHLEATLLAAFRAQHTHDAPPVTVAAIGKRVFPLRVRQRWMPRAVGATAAAAAAVLATFGIISPFWPTRDDVQQTAARRQIEYSQTELPGASPTVATLDETPVVDERGATQTNVAAPNETLRPPVRRNSARRRQASPSDATKIELAANRRAPVASSHAASSNATANDDRVEIATEFMPLVPGGTSGAVDGAQLMRVELPRAALASMGLPVNVDSGSGERVKADVLLGDDGLARAIRFVR